MWTFRSLRRLFMAIVSVSLVFFLYEEFSYISLEPPKNHETPVRLFQKFETKAGYTKGIERGKVNMDIWRGMCALSFNSLRQHPFFPSYSSIRSYLEIRDSFEIKVKGSSFGLRVVGYLHPPVSGYYSFHLRSYFMAQFWLSSKGPENAIKLAYATRNKLDKLVYFAGKFLPKSKRILLKEGQRYYFEILKVINSDAANVKDAIETRLEWMLPGQTSFTKIDGRRLSRYLDVSGNLSSYITPFDNLSPSLLFSDEEDKAVGPYFPPDQPPKPFMSKQFNRQNVHGLSYLDRQYTMKAFPKCKYTSRFMERKKFSGNHGVFVVAYPRVYPDDGSGSVRFTNVFKAFDKDDRHNGTIIMSKTVAQDTVASFMAGLNKTFSRTFELVDIIHIESVHDTQRGDRILLDLVVKNHQDNKLLRVSEFMFRNKTQNELCILHELEWNPKVWINIILNVKNQAQWVVHFIKDVSRVMKETGDQNINVIIVDYGNKGLDIGQEMKRYGIKSYEVVNQTGVFHKTASINLAASRVKDPNSIVLLMDLHLQLSQDFFDKIRKHTFQGILAFAPILFRLDACGRPRTKHLCPSGFWESLGFGIFSIYKSDWDNFGGMNAQKFTNKWGGEDWEMVDRVLSSGIEIDKQRVPGFYHFYHDKRGMWNN